MSEQDSSELGDILNQENLILEQVISILKVANKQSVIYSAFPFRKKVIFLMAEIFF